LKTVDCYKIAEMYTHVDNGGITIEVYKNDDKCFISINTMYHGNPDITTVLNLSKVCHKQFLRDFGLTLLKASESINDSD